MTREYHEPKPGKETSEYRVLLLSMIRDIVFLVLALAGAVTMFLIDRTTEGVTLIGVAVTIITNETFRVTKYIGARERVKQAEAERVRVD